MQTKVKVNEKQLEKARNILSNKIVLSKILNKYSRSEAVGGKGKICCPIHGEKTPSLHYDDAKKTFKCFGCGAGGTVSEFIYHMGLKETDKFSLMKAMRQLAKEYKIELPNFYEIEVEEITINNLRISKRKRGEISDDFYKDKINTMYLTFRTLPVDKQLKIYKLIDDTWLGLITHKNCYKEINKILKS